jgi:Tol biopolymer transport system component
VNGYGITIFNIIDGTTTELFAQGIDPRGAPFWSPEGARLVLQTQVDGNNMELYTVLIPTNEFTRLTTTPAYEGEPVWGRQ